MFKSQGNNIATVIAAVTTAFYGNIKIYGVNSTAVVSVI
jgi:hypothetical protein